MPDGRMYILTIRKTTKDLFSLDGQLTAKQESSLDTQANAALLEALAWYHRLADAGIYTTGEASGMPLLEEINGMVPFAHCPYCHEKQSWAKRKDTRRNEKIKILCVALLTILAAFTAAALILPAFMKMGDALLGASLVGLLAGGVLTPLFARAIKNGAIKKLASMQPGPSVPMIDWSGR